MFSPSKKNAQKAFIANPYGFHLAEHVYKIRMLFLRYGWQVQLLETETRTYHPNCVLIIPDTGGINTNVSYFKTPAPGIPPQDQGIESFRLNSLHYWVNKKVPIIGLGYSAFLTFAEVCGGNLLCGSDGLSFMHRKDVDIYETKFFGKRAAGFVDYQIDESLISLAESLLPKEAPPEDEVLVSVPIL
jgi:hypothetical protein